MEQNQAAAEAPTKEDTKEKEDKKHEPLTVTPAEGAVVRQVLGEGLHWADVLIHLVLSYHGVAVPCHIVTLPQSLAFIGQTIHIRDAQMAGDHHLHLFGAKAKLTLDLRSPHHGEMESWRRNPDQHSIWTVTSSGGLTLTEGKTDVGVENCQHPHWFERDYHNSRQYSSDDWSLVRVIAIPAPSAWSQEHRVFAMTYDGEAAAPDRRVELCAQTSMAGSMIRGTDTQALAHFWYRHYGPTQIVANRHLAAVLAEDRLTFYAPSDILGHEKQPAFWPKSSFLAEEMLTVSEARTMAMSDKWLCIVFPSEVRIYELPKQ